jgi:hypothetical protein
LRQDEGLGHDALRAHGGVTVHHDAQRLLAALAQILLGPDLALGNGICRLKRQHKEGSSLSDELKPHPRLAVVIVVVKRAYLEVRRVVD